MKKRSVAEEAARLLAGLGETADEIAANLRGAGYKGSTGNGYTCPCGSCLEDHFGRRAVYVKSDGCTPAGHYDTMSPHAEQVREFINRYDGEEYPDLIEPVAQVKP